MDTTTIHDLEAGQSLVLSLRRGDRLWVRQGSLLAEPPTEWVGETLLRRRERWPEGQDWTAAVAGTWQCRAVRRTSLVVQRRQRWAWMEIVFRAAGCLIGGPTAPAAPPPAARG